MQKILAIVITYNGKHWMDECLTSLEKSTCALDVIIIDNLSTDGTPEYIEQKFPQFELIKSVQNLGFGKANNLGLQKALDEAYDYVLLLNQDAWVEPDTVSILVNTLAQNPEYGIVSPIHLNRAKISLDNKFNHYICRTENNLLTSDLLLPNRKKSSVYELDFVNAAAWLLTRECIQKVGGFDPLFPHYGEDNDYIIRAKHYGFKIGFSPNAYIVHDREGYIKQPDLKQSYGKQYIDRLKLLKDIRLPYRSTYFLILKEEIYFALSFLLKLNFSMFFLKLRIIKRILTQYTTIKKSRMYCANTNTAYIK